MSIADFPQFAAACAILFSVVIRWLRSGASWESVEQGSATANELRELTGILDYDKLQETFGPPRLEDGAFRVTRRDVLRERIEIDMITFSGPAFAGVDNRLMSLQLVEQGLADAAMFTADGAAAQAAGAEGEGFKEAVIELLP